MSRQFAPAWGLIGARRPDLPSRSDAQYNSTVRRRKYLDDALNAKSNEPFKALGIYLTQVDDADAVRHLLDTLLRCDIPRCPFYNAAEKRKVEVAISVVSDINAILRSLHHVSVKLQEQYLKALAESWAHMVQWLHFFLTIASSSATHHAIITVCVETMVDLLDMFRRPTLDAQVRALVEEIVFSNYAIDYVFRLVKHSDPANDAPHIYIIGPVGCKLISLVLDYLGNDEAHVHFTNRLNAVQGHLRNQVLQRLVERAGYILELTTRGPFAHSAELLHTSLSSLYHLVQCTGRLLLSPSFSTTLLKCNFAYEYCKSLNALCSHARTSRPAVDGTMEQVWRRLECIAAWILDGLILCSPLDPLRVVASAVKGGLFEVGLYVIAHNAGRCERLERLFFIGISYLTLRAVYMEAHARGSALTDALDAAQSHSLCREIKEAMSRGFKVYLEGNAEARKDRMLPCAHCQGFPTGQSKHQTCAGCHGVIYCSVKCQEEDWVALHCGECPSLSLWYKGRQRLGYWTSLTLQRDYLLYIQSVANDLFPHTWRLEYAMDKCVIVLDFSSGTQFLKKDQYTSCFHDDKFWHDLGGIWGKRVLKMSQAQAQASTKYFASDRFTLVEAVFRCKYDISVIVLAVMRWNYSKPQSGYQVVGGFWRIAVAHALDPVRNLPRV